MSQATTIVNFQLHSNIFLMKKTAIAFLASLFLFASCGKKAEQNDTHTHEDGSAHQMHADTTKQELNAVDSVAQDSVEHGHSHDY